MIASRSGVLRLPRVIWSRDAKVSMKALMRVLRTNAWANARSRRKQIEDAIELLRHTPLRCPVEEVKDGLIFRRLVVRERFFVYYVYTPPRGMTSGGTLSIRSVKHAASEHPFLGVREDTGRPPAMLTTRDPFAESFTTA
jgi:plasmid stabilization system protein ParE